jgi:ribonucleoside-diphosphate reductase alpha chain
LNIFLPGNVSKKYLHEIHFRAWQKGLKSLYYCRSMSVQRADKVSNKVENDEMFKAAVAPIAASEKYEECLACQ